MTSTNPSRTAEQEAIGIVQGWVGTNGVVTDHCNSLEDFRIEYHDGRLGHGEVKVDFDETERRQWSALLKLQVDQTIQLAERSGSWWASIAPEASVKALSRELPGIIECMLANGVVGYDCSHASMNRDVSIALQSLGVENLQLVGANEGDRCILFPKSPDGLIPVDANAAVPWISKCFADARFSNSWMRLAVADAAEKHAFIWVASGAPDELELRIAFHPEDPPSLAPEIPGWLTHLWIGIPRSFTSSHWTWLFRPQIGWEALKG